MDFLKTFAASAEPKSDKPTDGKQSNSDLLSDAKVVAEACKAQFSNQPEKVDKGKAASSAADLLDAAESYGKLDQNQGIGKYVNQAEDYLRSYGTTTPPNPADVVAETKPAPAETTPEPEKKAEEKKPEEGGAGDYLKMGEALFNKPSGGGEGGGGAADVMKMAGSFFK